MKRLFIILAMLALYSCNNEAPVDVHKGDKTTQYVESLLANASKNLDLDALVEEFVSKAFVLETVYHKGVYIDGDYHEDVWKEDRVVVWPGVMPEGIVYGDDVCFVYSLEPIFAYPATAPPILRCDEYPCEIEQSNRELLLLFTGKNSDVTHSARLVDFIDGKVIIAGRLPFHDKRTADNGEVRYVYIGYFDVDIQAEWDAVIAEQDK